MLRIGAMIGTALALLVVVDSAEASIIDYRGKLVTGAQPGAAVRGTIVFSDNLPDLIPGGLEDWWESSIAAFSFVGNGINFATSSGSFSSLRIKYGAGGEDALRYDGVQGGNSLLLLLSGGGLNSLLFGTGNLTGAVPALRASGNLFQPCAIAPGGALYAGSCSQFATPNGAMLFQLTSLSIRTIPEPSTLLLTGLGFVALCVARRVAS